MCINVERGAALVELAMVVPFIIVIVFGALEFTRMLRIYHLASSLSREAANLGYRHCLVKDDPSSPQNVQECMNERVATNKVIEIRRFAAELVPQTRVIISAYRHERHDALDYFAKVAIAPDGTITATPPPKNSPNFDRDASLGTKQANMYDFKSKFSLAGNCITVTDRRGPNRRLCREITGPSGPLTTLAKRHNIIFIGEAYVPNSPLVRGIAQFFDRDPARYDAVIL